MVLKNFKTKVNSDTLSVNIKGVRKTRMGNVLIKVGTAEGGRKKLTSALKEVVRAEKNMRELAPRTKIKILDLDTTTDELEVREALKRHFGGDPDW